MRVYNFPEQTEQAIAAQVAGEEYLLAGNCVVCGQSILIQQCTYGFEPRCSEHEYVYDLDEQSFDRLGIALIEVRTGPCQSTIIVDPHERSEVYAYGKPVPGTSEWLYLGCPVFLHRMACESDEVFHARAQQEAEDRLNDGFYRDVEW